MLSASLNKTFPFFLVSSVFMSCAKNMQQSVVCVRYELGTFWFRYLLTKDGYVLVRYVSVGYVLVLYILTETIYKLKVHDF